VLKTGVEKGGAWEIGGGVAASLHFQQVVQSVIKCFVCCSFQLLLRVFIATHQTMGCWQGGSFRGVFWGLKCT